MTRVGKSIPVRMGGVSEGRAKEKMTRVYKNLPVQLGDGGH